MCQSDCTWDHIMILEKRGLSDVVLECECNLSCQWVTLKWPDRMCLHSTWERVMILEHQTLSWVTVDSLKKDAIRYITCYLSACVPPNELEYCDRYLERRNESLRIASQFPCIFVMCLGSTDLASVFDPRVYGWRRRMARLHWHILRPWKRTWVSPEQLQRRSIFPVALVFFNSLVKRPVHPFLTTPDLFPAWAAVTAAQMMCASAHAAARALAEAALFL